MALIWCALVPQQPPTMVRRGSSLAASTTSSPSSPGSPESSSVELSSSSWDLLLALGLMPPTLSSQA